jgi:hypothetical protein
LKVSALSVVSAWSGVLETVRRMLATFASGQSKVIKSGYGAVRLKNVYIPRR